MLFPDSSRNIMSQQEDASEDEKDFIGFSPQKPKESIQEIDAAIKLAKELHVYKAGVELVVGSKLEVLDARDNKWYLCKVVEVDWGELDIRVHYERWSTRFDEWLKMDSTRIRKVSTPSSKETNKVFKIGERVLGFWAPDGQQYPAQVVKHVTDDTWTVLFMDGITKTLRRSQIKKPQTKEEIILFNDVIDAPSPSKSKQVEKPEAPKMLQPVPVTIKTEDSADASRSIFSVEILPQKRKTKRKQFVEELFQSIKRRKKSERDEFDDDPEYKTPVKKMVKVIKKEPLNDTLEYSPDRLTLDLGAAVMKMDADATASSDGLGSPAYADDHIEIKEEIESSYGEQYESDDSNIFEGFQQTSQSLKVNNLSPQPGSLNGVGVLLKIKTEAPSTDLDMSPCYSPDVSHVCPDEECGKSFRKRNLLHMHMKHYHADLVKDTQVASLNMADLAYARTADDHVIMTSSTPGDVISSKADPIRKLKERRRTISKSRKDSECGIIDSDWEEPDASRIELFAHELDHEVIKKKPRKPRRSGPSESMSEDDPVEAASTIKRKGYRRKARTGTPKPPTTQQDDVLLQQSADPDAIINCGCGMREEDGLMLQCDVCLCWQHGSCYGIEQDHQVPDKYICQICDNPAAQRASARFRHHQEYVKEGKLPRFSFSTNDNSKHMESFIRKGYELLGNVLQSSQVIHSMRVKLNMAKQDDHPKLFMWHKEWNEPADEFDAKEATCDAIADATRVNPDTTAAFEVPESHAVNSSLSVPNLEMAVSLSEVDRPTYTPATSDTTDPLIEASQCKSTSITDHAEDHRATLNDSMQSVNSDLHLNLSSSSVEIEKSFEESSMTTPISTSTPRPQQSVVEKRPDPLTTANHSHENTDPKVNLDEFDFNLGLGASVSSGFDILATKDALVRLVQQASTELAPLVQQPIPAQLAPIIPETERIQPVKCKLNLLSHIEKNQTKLFNRFDYIEKQLEALEAEMGLNSEFTEDEEQMLSDELSEVRDPVTLQARSLVQMIVKDLDTVSTMIQYIPPKA